MGLLDKIFGNEHTASPKQESSFAGVEQVSFGRYSDNNKSYEQTKLWQLAENSFKTGDYANAFKYFFAYITDEAAANVTFSQNGTVFDFDLIQGSKKINGHCDGTTILVKVPIAKMDGLLVPVMRRLLEMNYSLFYSHCALSENNEIFMLVDLPVVQATPQILYYSIRELAIAADRLDDTLADDFNTLIPLADTHLEHLSQHELDVKYKYFTKWIDATLEHITKLNANAFAVPITYQLLTLIYRIENLIVPEGKLLIALEAISELYWGAGEEVQLIDKNDAIIEAVKELRAISVEDFEKSLYRTTATFSLAIPPPLDKFRQNIINANRDANIIGENEDRNVAETIAEYGFVYNLFAYSLPLVIKDLMKIAMAVIHANYFKDLGLEKPFYTPENNEFNKAKIESTINDIITNAQDKYPQLQWDHSAIQYDTLLNFITSFSTQLTTINMLAKK